MKSEKIVTEMAPQPVGPYSQAIKSGNFLFVSGQLGINPKTGMLIGESFLLQAEQALKNIFSIIDAANFSIKNIVRFEVFLTDINDFKEFNELYLNFLGKDMAPARQVVEVSGLPLGAKIEVSCICHKVD